MLAARGAVVMDADAIVRDLQRPGTDVFARIVERFGGDVVLANGELDRTRLAAIVFADEDARADLNAIVHPEVWAVIQRRLEELKETDAVVILDVPLLAEAGGGAGLDLVVTVEADGDVRLARLARDRGMSPEDVRARMATQASDEQRRALADIVITNDGDEFDLRAQVDALWERLSA